MNYLYCCGGLLHYLIDGREIRRSIDIVYLLKFLTVKLLLLDNHDSFTFNLLQIIREWGKCSCTVLKAEQLINYDIRDFDKLMISPGPGLPHETPLLLQTIGKAVGHLSVLGVCLGHQAIACYFGGKLRKAKTICHGEVSEVKLTSIISPVFRSIPGRFDVGRYHSWVVDPNDYGSGMQVTAITKNGTIMALQHQHLPVYGVQFHPESIMTPYGAQIVQNWLNM